MHSPRIYVHHIFKTAGSSLWRDIITSSQDSSSLPEGHVIAVDLYKTISEEIGEYSQVHSQEVLQRYWQENETALYPFDQGHRILVHLHHSFCFDPSIQRYLRSYWSLFAEMQFRRLSKTNQQITSQGRQSSIIHLLTTRDSKSRFKSHLMDIFDRRTQYTPYLQSISHLRLKSLRESEFFQIKQALIANDLDGYLHSIVNSRAAPLIATHQLRSIVGILHPCTLKYPQYLDDHGSIRFLKTQLCRLLANSRFTTDTRDPIPKLGFTFLDANNCLLVSPNSQHALADFEIKGFRLNTHYKGTKTTSSDVDTKLEASLARNARLQECFDLEDSFLNKLLRLF